VVWRWGGGVFSGLHLQGHAPDGLNPTHHRKTMKMWPIGKNPSRFANTFATRGVEPRTRASCSPSFGAGNLYTCPGEVSVCGSRMHSGLRFLFTPLPQGGQVSCWCLTPPLYAKGRWSSSQPCLNTCHLPLLVHVRGQPLSNFRPWGGTGGGGVFTI